MAGFTYDESLIVNMGTDIYPDYIPIILLGSVAIPEDYYWAKALP
jgi:hypothetical protein